MIQTRLRGCTTLVLLSALFGCGDDTAGPGDTAVSDATDGAAAADGTANSTPDAAAGPHQPEAAEDASVQDGGAGDGARQHDASSMAEAMSDVQGRVFSASSHQPLQDAVVEVAGGPATSTDDRGRFSLRLALSGRIALAATLDGFAPGIERVNVADGMQSPIELQLSPIGSTTVIDASQGGTVDSAHGQLSIPPRAFVHADGSAVEGQVEIQLTALDPTLPGQLAACPGDFSARLEDGTQGLLQMVVPVDISARQAGELLGLAAGTQLQVSLPVPPSMREAASTNEALWSLDPATASWRQEGEAVLRVAGERAFYDAAIGHLSWWSAARWLAVTCVRGCVTFENAPVPQVWVTANGISFSNQGSSWAAEDGCFVEDVGAAERFSVRAAAIEGVSQPVVVDAPATEMTAGQDPAACFDIGTLELLPRPADADDCPSGSVSCGELCVDLYDDPDQCGACGARCDNGQICIAGRCDCAPGSALCGGACTDTSTNWQHCGQCDQECSDGERCSDGACEPIICVAGLQLCGNECVDVTSRPEVCGGCVVGFGARGGRRGSVGPCDDTCPGSGGATRCVDFQNDRDDCGSCGNVCATGQHCHLGTCVPIVCGAGQTLCENACVDGDSCGVACGSGEICDGGVCRCPSDTYCDGECVDPTSSTAHCGGCTPRPDPGSTSSNNAAGCELAGYPDSCPRDGGGVRCTDFQSDRNHCGGCDNACADGQHCVAASCVAVVCPQGQTLCGHVCVEGQSCGMACAPGEVCLNGSCDCPSDFYCGQECVDTMTSVDHCGGCAASANAMGIGPPCSTIECCTNLGYDALCPDGNGVACARLQTSRSDCGSCGNACAEGESCEAGACVPIVCPAGQVLCGNLCLDGDTCGQRCDSCSEQCVAGSCTPLATTDPECL